MAEYGMQSAASQIGHESKVEPLIYHYKVSDEFCKKVREITERLEMPAEGANWLMAAMNYETAGTFRPDIKNGVGSGGTGLIQFMPTTAKGLGTTTHKLAQMDAIAQLDYVEKYFKPYKGKIHSLEDVYLAIFYPLAMNKGDDFVLGSEYKDPKKREQKIADIYQQNYGFDKKKNGGNDNRQIERGEVVGVIRSHYEKGLAESGRTVSSSAEIKTYATNKSSAIISTTSSKSSVNATDNGKYVVKKGDTLSKIATWYAVKGGYQALADFNGIEDPSHIGEGQIIMIPGATSSKSSVNATDNGKNVATQTTKPKTNTTSGAGKPAVGSKQMAHFLRSNYPNGFNVCFRYKKASGGDKEFKTQADELCKEYNTIAIQNGTLKSQAYTIMSSKDALQTSINNITASVRKCLADNPQEGFDDSKVGQIKNMAFLCHGYVSEKGNKDAGGLNLGGGYLKESDLKGFVANIRGSVADDIRVQLYACNCARNQRQGSAGKDGQQEHGDWNDRGSRSATSATDTYRNGDNSFADILAEELGGNASVYGHTTKGPATNNFAARVYGRDANNATNGVSMFDIYFPQSFVAAQAQRTGKDETTIRTSMYKYYRNNFALDNAARSSFMDPEKHGQRLRNGWLSANP